MGKVTMSPLASEKDNPDNYASLSLYLERTGQISLIPKAKMLKARSLFVMKGHEEQSVADELGLSIGVVFQWVTMFDWREKRDTILFRQFQLLEDLKQNKSANMDMRHDRIASSLEATVESMIHKHHDENDEFILSPKDLTSLATTMKSMQVIRRIVHDKPTSKSEVSAELLIDSGPGLDNLVRMVSGLVSGDRQMIEAPTKQITVTIDDSNDTEYEE